MEYEILNDKSGVKKERVLEGHRKGLLGVIRPKKFGKLISREKERGVKNRKEV